MKRRNVSASVCVALCIAGLVAPSAGAATWNKSTASSQTKYELSSARSEAHLLNSKDFPAGWTQRKSFPLSLHSCTSPSPPIWLLGDGSSAVYFTHDTGLPLAFEYLTKSSANLNAFRRVTNAIVSDQTCTNVINGQQIDSSVLAGRITVPNYGDEDFACKFDVTSVIGKGVTSQLGYLFVRKGDYLMAVIYQNRGTLSKQALESFTRKALSRLNS